MIEVGAVKVVVESRNVDVADLFPVLLSNRFVVEVVTAIVIRQWGGPSPLFVVAATTDVPGLLPRLGIAQGKTAVPSFASLVGGYSSMLCEMAGFATMMPMAMPSASASVPVGDDFVSVRLTVY